jgi:UrcA family protein
MTRLALAGAALATILGAGAAPAQTYYGPASYAPPPPAYTTGDITVYAPRYQPRGSEGAPIYRVRQSRRVHTGDLDLASYSGAREARNRIERAARDACYAIDAQWPRINDPSGPDCYGRAVRGAMADVEYQLGFAPPTWPDYG